MLKYFVFCLLAVSCRGVPLTENQQGDVEEDVFATAYIKFNHFENEMLPPEACGIEHLQMIFKLYTRENPNGHEIDPYDYQTLKDASFNVKQDSKILIHEWLQNETHSYAKDFVSAFLRYKREPVNIFTVDYGSVSRCSFKQVRAMQPHIAHRVGHLLESLIEYGSVPLKFHLIGLGMGAQIAGISARQIHPRKVGRLTALDPTFLGYLNNKPQLVSNDSDYMDVIHTAQRKLDLVQYLGNARFFPNDGTRQPLAAGKNPTEASILSHVAAAFYYIQSIVDITYMKGKLCDNYRNYLIDKCPKPPVQNNMGDEVNIKLKGNFYLGLPSSVPPFSNREIMVTEVEKEYSVYYKIVTPRGVFEISKTLTIKVKAEYEKTIYEKTYNEDEIKEIVKQQKPKSRVAI